MAAEPDPVPTVMTVDREAWAKQLHLSNFVNTYYQYRDLQSLPGIHRILIVGPGQGLDTTVLRWRGYDVVTIDIDETFHPDMIGSVHSLSMFSAKEFDAVIASHVIEHLPINYLDRALSELARVAKYALVYVPSTGRSFQLRVIPGVYPLRWSWTVDVYNWFRRPNPARPLFCGSQHYWEVGRIGFSSRALRRRFNHYFDILDAYRNQDWHLSFNFVLKAKVPEQQ